MNWIEIHITCDAKQAEEISEQLQLWGADAVTFQDAADQPIYEPKPGQNPDLWHDTIVIGLFGETQPIDEAVITLEQKQAEGLVKNFHIKMLPNQDWVRLNLDSFKPIPIGKRLCICPSWLEAPNPNAVNIILDPGLAFGTGSHPTTALCLAWLDEHMDSQSLVIDYGCGSGILAIAALKLGAKKVIAIDYDPQALIATRANAERNNIPKEQLETYLPNEFQSEINADLVMANILAKPLIELKDRFVALTKPNGQILLSGILDSQVVEIMNFYQDKWQMESPIIQDGWACLAGIKK